MSYKTNMRGYEAPRTIFQVDALHAWQHDEYFAPVIVEVSPTGSCNQECTFCYSDKIETKGQKISREVLVNLFRELPRIGVKAVSLQGTGEPLMHSATPEAIQAGAAGGLGFSLTTTGVVLTDKIQRKILEHLTFVKFSVLDSNKTRYSMMHGCPEQQWEQLVKNIAGAAELRAKEGYDVALMGTVYVERNNFNQMPEIVRFLRDLGMDYIVVQEATYTEFTPGRQSQNTSTFFSAEQIAEMKQAVAEVGTEDFTVKVRFPIDDNTYHVGIYKDCWKDRFCQGIKFFPVVAADGNVYSCYRAWGKKELSLGSLYEHSFEEIWKSQRRLEIEEKIMTTPPDGDECAVCGISKLNDILEQYRTDNKFRNFLI